LYFKWLARAQELGKNMSFDDQFVGRTLHFLSVVSPPPVHTKKKISIIKLECNSTYIQWLKATQQPGANMGIDSHNDAALFAFLELVLSPEACMTKNIVAYGPSLVSAVGVEISMENPEQAPSIVDKTN
jgi:hypothetical protein